MYIIRRNNKRYNNKTFLTYEEARKYVRRTITKLVGGYVDSFTPLGFNIVAK